MSQSLDFNVLRGNDNLRAACLKGLGSQNGMELYVADLDQTCSDRDYDPNLIYDGDYHIIDDVEELVVTLSQLACPLK